MALATAVHAKERDHIGTLRWNTSMEITHTLMLRFSRLFSQRIANALMSAYDGRPDFVVSAATLCAKYASAGPSMIAT